MPLRTTRVLFGICCLPLLAACSSSEGPVGVPDPGAPARIIFSDVGFAGGQGLRTAITIDSATSTYSLTTCTEGVGISCEQTTQQRTGATPVAVRDELFARAASGEFRRLRSEYRRASSVVPPDPYDAELTITAGERTREIAWEKGAVVPGLLSTFVCHLRAATGELISCPPL
jgi:hypothetical protein